MIKIKTDNMLDVLLVRYVNALLDARASITLEAMADRCPKVRAVVLTLHNVGQAHTFCIIVRIVRLCMRRGRAVAA